MKELSGEALVAAHQECSVDEMTSGTETFLRSHTAVGGRGWRPLCGCLRSELLRSWAAPSLGPHPVSRRQDHSTGL